jgi:hypothetical protein
MDEVATNINRIKEELVDVEVQMTKFLEELGM